ncbi:hypothetical protein [Brevibacillus sp. FIR094]|uniref:hypothetical protein n=1 Tax=Brevibacillus sp. FIR094 TaxID=3134809 RepID=UPI003D1CFAFE
MRKSFEIRAYVETNSEVTKSEISREFIEFLKSKEWDFIELVVNEKSISGEVDLWDDFDEGDPWDDDLNDK